MKKEIKVFSCVNLTMKGFKINVYNCLYIMFYHGFKQEFKSNYYDGYASLGYSSIFRRDLLKRKTI